jgi:hypothetical protein
MPRARRAHLARATDPLCRPQKAGAHALGSTIKRQHVRPRELAHIRTAHRRPTGKSAPAHAGGLARWTSCGGGGYNCSYARVAPCTAMIIPCTSTPMTLRNAYISFCISCANNHPEHPARAASVRARTTSARKPVRGCYHVHPHSCRERVCPHHVLRVPLPS